MRSFFILSCFVFAACGGDDVVSNGNTEELITTITLSFQILEEEPTVFEFNDADGDGGDPPTIDAIELPYGRYKVAVGFENRLEDPPEIITAEVSDERAEHQVFFTGTGISGPASEQPRGSFTHTYNDRDENGLPVGLANILEATGDDGELTVTLRHLPELNGSPQKTPGLADTVKTGGIGAIPGDTDATATFPVRLTASF